MLQEVVLVVGPDEATVCSSEIKIRPKPSSNKNEQRTSISHTIDPTIYITATNMTVSVGWHALVALLIKTPGQTAIVMHRRPPHVSPVLSYELTTNSSVHCARIIPDNHVSNIVLLHINDVLVPYCVVKQRVQNGLGLFG
jgi:hypothetical protein